MLLQIVLGLAMASPLIAIGEAVETRSSVDPQTNSFQAAATITFGVNGLSGSGMLDLVKPALSTKVPTAVWDNFSPRRTSAGFPLIESFNFTMSNVNEWTTSTYNASNETEPYTLTRAMIQNIPVPSAGLHTPTTCNTTCFGLRNKTTDGGPNLTGASSVTLRTGVAAPTFKKPGYISSASRFVYTATLARLGLIYITCVWV